jgi:predicted glycosyltransferase
LRSEIIRRTAEMFRPGVFLVDKEPLGLRGEVRDTLAMLKAQGTTLILGLRDIMDDPEQLAEEWKRKNVLPTLNDLYDQIWMYGLPQINDPLQGISVGANVRTKSVYTGYLRRTVTPITGASMPIPDMVDKPFILVSPGGGGDGDTMIDWVLRAYEQDPQIPYPAFVVFGPFMHTSLQAEFMNRVERLNNVHAITFDARIESIMANAVGVVAMGGYNLFCEILSFDKRAIIVPRTVPRMEQYIRASKAEKLGLVRMLADDGVRDAGRMAEALRQLPDQQKPSDVHIPGLLDGLSTINGLLDGWMSGAEPKKTQHLSLVNDAL